jgi:DNA mismatch endonuclease (patch repair protein)
MESAALRRHTMQAVKSKDTKPELFVRRLLHARGYRYTLHKRDLPGCPDMVFPSRHKVIFVHGCFWHGHHCQRGARVPKSNTDYWTAKVARNRARDQATRKRLKTDGWTELILWECELRDEERIARRIERFLL